MTTPRHDIGFILHYPLNAAIKGNDVDWQLVPVDLAHGRDLADRLTHLRNATGTDAFGDPIVPAPSASSPADVEHDTEGDDARHVASPSDSSPGGADDRETSGRASVVTPSGTSAAITEALAESDDRREQLLARYRNLTPADVAVFVMPDDRTDLDAIEAELDRVESFADVAAAPQSRWVEVAASVNDAMAAWRAIDEGDDCTADDVAKAGARYTALDAAAKSWVTEAGAKVRLNPGSGGVASVRRRDILTGLLEMAEGKRDVDDLVRALLAHILGDIVWQGATLADTLAALTVDEARQFAGLAALVGMVHDPFDFGTPDRVALTPDVVARAAA